MFENWSEYINSDKKRRKAKNSKVLLIIKVPNAADGITEGQGQLFFYVLLKLIIGKPNFKLNKYICIRNKKKAY